jgi:hypothetical protein
MKNNGVLFVTRALAGAVFELVGSRCSTTSPAAEAATDASNTPGSDASGSGSSSGGSGSSGGAALTWFSTCGDPDCHPTLPDAGGLTDDAGTPCPAIGSACSVAGGVRRQRPDDTPDSLPESLSSAPPRSTNRQLAHA